ncbi:hypothetical protein [Paenibacillus mangrovi]|uniref:hypothetical protein n=1 Tax=Paenibacillus mangrovi TaxID=2931978 RepID=UPI003CC7F41D
MDDPASPIYPLATDAAGEPDAFFGRLCRDLGQNKSLNIWIVSDNLMKSAA